MGLTFAGIKIVSNPMLVEQYEDWSRVRSPGRARRRLRLGHPQRIEVRSRPMTTGFMLGRDTMVMHPAMVAELEKRCAAGAALTRQPSATTLSRRAGEGLAMGVLRTGIV